MTSLAWDDLAMAALIYSTLSAQPIVVIRLMRSFRMKHGVQHRNVRSGLERSLRLMRILRNSGALAQVTSQPHVNEPTT